MAKRGRRVEGAGAVTGMQGSEGAKERLEVILETMAGNLTIEEACAKLSIGRSAFYELRQKALTYALEALEPGLPGRPRLAGNEEDERVTELEEEVRGLRINLEASRIREELAIAMPHLLDNKHKKTKKKKKRKQAQKQKKQNRRK
jgi:hypothetical protein